MTTGEKISVLRKKKGLTQEQLSEILKVSRQSVSRWEMDVAFPETEKLIKLSRLLECSIDFLLNEEIQDDESVKLTVSVSSCYRFIRECSYFFLATSVDDKPRLRPMGIIYSDEKTLFISTDKRKNVYEELTKNPQVEIVSYNLNTGKWIRISGRMKPENSGSIRTELMEMYPMIRQEYVGENEMYLAIFKMQIDNINIY